jgi:MoaA/NifB/PqqE/SkfB family radical SAM enzyme
LHCSQDAGPFRSESLSLEKALEIVREARTLGADTIAISGGEPLCSPNLIPICEFAKSLGLRVFVYTAGSITEKNRLAPINDTLAQNLARLGVDRIIVNLQAANRELHDKVTGRRGSYDNVISSVRKLVSVGLRVEIHFVPMKINFQELPKVVNLAYELGVAQVNVIRFVPQGRGFRNISILQLGREEYESFAQVVILAVRESKVPIRVSEAFAFLHLKSEYQCMAGRKKIVVSGDGAVCPCSAFKGFLAGNPAYNVNERSLRDVLNSGIFRSLRENDSLSGVNCGCPAQRLIADGKIGPGADSNCVTHALKPATELIK